MVATAQKNRHSDLLAYILKRKNIEHLTEADITQLKSTIIHFSDKINKRWEKCSRKRQVFLEKFSSWLNKDDLAFKVTSLEVQSSSAGRRGRPEICFEESSEKTKKKKGFQIVKRRLRKAHLCRAFSLDCKTGYFFLCY